MVKHALFLKWWLYFAATCAGIYIAYQLGIFEEIYKKDSSKLSFVIMAGFAFMSIWCGKITFTVSKALNSKPYFAQEGKRLEKAIKQEEHGWFACSKFEQIGYVGTLIGFIIMLAGFANIDPSQLKSLQALIVSLGAGMATALYTTLVGLICSHLLSYQYYNLGQAIRELEDEV